MLVAVEILSLHIEKNFLFQLSVRPLSGLVSQSRALHFLDHVNQRMLFLQVKRGRREVSGGDTDWPPRIQWRCTGGMWGFR